jgi:hypothetical protein
MEELFKHVFANDLSGDGSSEYPEHIRMPDYEKSFWLNGKPASA